MHGVFISALEASNILLSGGVVAVPTETVYGLAALADDDNAVEQIFSYKSRPSDNPLIVHVLSIQQAGEVAWFGTSEIMLMEAFWPGPLTLVMPYRDSVCYRARAGLDTVAVRLPDHPVLHDILNAVGKPLVAPSANRSGKPSPTTAQHVVDDFSGKISVVDGGPCRIGLESTVARVKNNQVSILRAGTVTTADFEKLGFEVLSDPGEFHRSPGTLYRHYAPAADIILCYNKTALLTAVRQSESSVVLSASDPGLGIEWRVLDAKTFYSELRRADALGVKEILVHCDSIVRSNPALMDRLTKASQLGTNGNGT